MFQAQRPPKRGKMLCASLARILNADRFSTRTPPLLPPPPILPCLVTSLGEGA
jgi:hypothetical protein